MLPLHTLRLYETGVGYFERRGSIPRADQEGLPVPAGHLDDALKTLVVLSGNKKALVEGIEFGSRLSNGPARALAGLPKDGEGPITYEDLLRSLEGSPVAVRTKQRSIQGRLIHVEDARPPVIDKEVEASKTKEGASKPGNATEKGAMQLSVLTTNGEIVRIDASDLVSVRPSDPAHAARLDRALESLLAHGAASHHDLRLLGRPGEDVTLGYIAETPVWRTSYRLVSSNDPTHATLQAWALLHNDTDEDWHGVRTELVNGRPDSFIFPLAAPRYSRRQLVTPQHELSTVAQLSGVTADSLWGDHVGDAFGAGGMGLSGMGEGGGGTGEGIGLGSIGSIGHGAGASSESSLLEVGDLAPTVSATGEENGALFVYRIPTVLSLRAHSSSLVPFLQESISTERVAWIDSRGSEARSGVRIVNDTSQTLPPGTISFFFDGGFAGEAALDRVRSKERRFLTFGADIDVDVTEMKHRVGEEVKRLTFSGNDVKSHFVRTTESEWQIENRSGQARSVFMKLDIKRNATLTGADAIDFDDERPIAIFRAAPHSRFTRETTSKEGLMNATRLESLNAKFFTDLSTSSALAAADKAVAVAAASAMKEIDEIRLKTVTAQQEVASIEKERARLREDAHSLGEHGGQEKLVTKMVAAEERTRALQVKVEELKKSETQRLDALRTVLSKLGKE